MSIFFSLHAQNQLVERRLSRKIIEKVLRAPESVLSGRNGRKIAQKLVTEGKFKFLYRVIYEEKAGNTTVVTAYKTTNFARYSVKK